MNTVGETGRRTRERNSCRLGTVRQQMVRHLDVAAIELGEGCLDPRPSSIQFGHPSVRAVSTLTPESRPPDPSRVPFRLPKGVRIASTGPADYDNLK